MAAEGELVRPGARRPHVKTDFCDGLCGLRVGSTNEVGRRRPWCAANAARCCVDVSGAALVGLRVVEDPVPHEGTLSTRAVLSPSSAAGSRPAHGRRAVPAPPPSKQRRPPPSRNQEERAHRRRSKHTARAHAPEQETPTGSAKGAAVGCAGPAMARGLRCTSGILGRLWRPPAAHESSSRTPRIT